MDSGFDLKDIVTTAVIIVAVLIAWSYGKTVGEREGKGVGFDAGYISGYGSGYDDGYDKGNATGLAAGDAGQSKDTGEILLPGQWTSDVAERIGVNKSVDDYETARKAALDPDSKVSSGTDKIKEFIVAKRSESNSN